MQRSLPQDRSHVQLLGSSCSSSNVVGWWTVVAAIGTSIAVPLALGWMYQSQNGRHSTRKGTQEPELNHKHSSPNHQPTKEEKKTTSRAAATVEDPLSLHDKASIIERVLLYWFGQAPPDVNQKHLWMIQNAQRLSKVDAEIYHQFASLLCQLSASHQTTKQQQQQQQQHGWWNDPLFGYRAKVAAIVVLDQFSRHIHRYCQQQQQQQQQQQSLDTTDNSSSNNNKNHTTLEFPPPPQATLDQQALQLAQAFLQDHQQELETGMIPTPMMVFSLLPFRHAARLETVQVVQTCLETTVVPLVQQSDTLVRRFRTATHRRLAVLQDSARRVGQAPPKQQQQPQAQQQRQVQGQQSTKHNPPPSSSTTTTTDTPTTTNDSSSSSSSSDKTTVFRDEDILETMGFEANLTTVPQHVVVTTMVEFLRQQGIEPPHDKHTKKSTNNQSNHNDTNTNHKNKAVVVVSLSGGVDSMVIAFVLSELVRAHGYGSVLTVVAVHIDYANRPESVAEAAFVQQWCRDQPGIAQVVVRRIDCVTRGVTARDEYETISRQIRFDLYHQVMQDYPAAPPPNTNKDTNTNDPVICTTTNNKTTKTAVVGIVLGHHRGDLRENVLSNAHKGCGPLDLSGMTAVSPNNGVTLLRPFLTLEKTCIFDFAHTFGVPVRSSIVYCIWKHVEG